MKYSYNLSVIDSIACKIKIEDKQKRYEHGSGVIIQMDTEEYVYILTAKHCILGKELNYKREDVDITVYIKCNDTYKEIRINDQDIIIYDDNSLNDRAIIILKKEKDKVLADIKSIGFLNFDSIPIECFLRGYPAPYNVGEATLGITVGMCQFIENSVISTKTKLETNAYDEALYNISGCSGGGVFVFYNNKPYLVSIVYEFEELFQRIKVNNIFGYNELLKDNKYTLMRFDEYSAEKDIPLSKLKYAYQKAKLGWLKDRYIPDLHVVGKIQHVTENIIQSDRIVLNMLYSLINNKNSINEVLDIINYNIQDNRLKAITGKLNKILKYLNALIKDIDKLILCIRNDNLTKYKKTTENSIDLDELIYNVTIIEKKNYEFRNVGVLREELEKLKNFKIVENINNIITIYETKFLIFLGEPGTGKTHALSNIVDKQLNNNLPAIIIQAKQYANAASWKEILVDVLGLSNNLSEDDIWNALEDTASRCEIVKKDIKDLENKEIKFEERVLICVDGIDEATSVENLVDRIRELDLTCAKHKRLRFIISSRPYKLRKIDIKNKFTIPINGDIYVHDIFDEYVKKYDVRFETESIRKRVKWSLRTPLALKLFCEKYSHNQLSKGEKIYVTISNLLSEKIDRIDNEINISLNNLWTDTEFIIRNILINIVTYFIADTKYKIEHNKLINLLTKEDKLSCLNKLNLSKILKYLVEYGLLYATKESATENPLEDPKIYYEIQIQPLVDYLIAIKLRDIDITKNKNFPKVLDGRVDAQRIYSLMLLEEKKIIVGSNGVWYDYYDREELIRIQSFALANVSDNLAENYKDFIENIMRRNTKNFRIVVNNLISEVARIPNHPLGAEFLHKILMSYNTPAERDIIWSGPEMMKYNNNELWEGTSECICSVKGLELTSEDTFEGLPLVYVWYLTNLDNKIRTEVRNGVTMWAIDNPSEYCKLLNKVFATNDPQMREDLMVCLLGVISSMAVSDEELKKFAEWIMLNIFSEGKIQSNRSVLIRFVARIIVEMAFKRNLIDKEEVLLARPPYKFNSVIDIELSKKVIDKNSEAYSPITGDLSWYIIKKAYKDFFKIDRKMFEEEKQSRIELMEFMKKLNDLDSQIGTQVDEMDNNISDEDIDELDNHVINEEIDKSLEKRLLECEEKQEEEEVSLPEYSSEAIKFLEMHGAVVDRKFIMPHMFALAAAINFIEKMGWDNQFKKYSNDGDKEVYGYDIAISRQYRQATHGSMSSVMTSGEKYAWCAVHEIQGYLADRLPYYGYTDSGEEKYILEDYSVLIDISNTFIGIQEIDEYEMRNKNYPYIPNQLVPEIGDLKNDHPNNIKKWIDRAEYPDFKPWLVSDNEAMMKVSGELTGSWTSIYNYTVLTERYTHSDSILWINSYLIKDNDYQLFRDQLKNEKESFIQHFVKTHVEDYSYPNVGTYMDPVTVNLIDWVEDLSAKHSIEYKVNGESKYYEVFKTISKVTYKNNNDEELCSFIPSKVIRSLLNISTIDNFNYKDSKNECIMFNSITGNKYGNEQNLLYVKTQNINEVLRKKGYRMFWLVKVLREPSLEARDKYKGFFYDRYCVWIITDDSFEMYKLCDEPKVW
ncbi:ATP-binding protein [Clostridium algidicarnis]|uniref:ATP-binding protein n=1 Tax=Clostridium algidicarnis TaxID=37659 RepID=UPI001CF1F0D1|nr:ATP-binding protein [Clostridium algidicarnis]MCB2286608.1 ATP-binding protein [Clostridium algidicarnis]